MARTKHAKPSNRTEVIGAKQAVKRKHATTTTTTAPSESKKTKKQKTAPVVTATTTTMDGEPNTKPARRHHNGAVAQHEMEKQSKRTDFCWRRARIQRAIKEALSDDNVHSGSSLRVTGNAFKAVQQFLEHATGIWIERAAKEAAHRGAVRIDGPDVVRALDVVNHPQQRPLKNSIMSTFAYSCEPIQTKFEKDRLKRRIRREASLRKEGKESEEVEEEEEEGRVGGGGRGAKGTGARGPVGMTTMNTDGDNGLFYDCVLTILQPYIVHVADALSHSETNSIGRWLVQTTLHDTVRLATAAAANEPISAAVWRKAFSRWAVWVLNPDEIQHDLGSEWANGDPDTEIHLATSMYLTLSSTLSHPSTRQAYDYISGLFEEERNNVEELFPELLRGHFVVLHQSAQRMYNKRFRRQEPDRDFSFLSLLLLSSPPVDTLS